ncbi:glycosyltransferase family 2 protein [Bacillus manliponensis]|uniref:glycosyltransferase family 2 protein n=1 Tax=Bacillus manliponensis TaxID=574376 RepID=UPI000B2330C8|nr:glycosyltransferase family 2 protein [Bacillus manliponensis]
MNVKQTPAISIVTLVFNVENYIRECVESVLNQTFTNFEWIILNNGCTDKTNDILDEYAKKDNRIKLFRNPKNSVLHNEPFNPDFVYYIEHLTSKYYCMLDSDDYLHTDFLKDLYTAAQIYDADIAIGGTEMFMDENVQIFQTRIPPKFYTKDIASLSDILPQIYGCFRPVWGKLIKVTVVKKQQEYRKQFPLNLTNGSDTVFNLDCLRFSNTVVGIDKVLYYYRIRKTSSYHTQIDTNRYLDYVTIYDESTKLLKQWNKLNDSTLNFINHVLYLSIYECIDMTANSLVLPLYEKINIIEAICNDQYLYGILNQNGLTINLFIDTQKSVEGIIEELTKDEFQVAVQHYIYRLFTSIKMEKSNPLNKHRAISLYLSALCDEKNRNRFGSAFLYDLFTFLEKDILADLKNSGLKSAFLASSPVLLRELVNSQFAHVIQICEEHSGDKNYALIKEELQRESKDVNESIPQVNASIQKEMSDTELVKEMNLLISILDHYPLDKEALSYKVELLILQKDMKMALETAEVLRVFYPNDSTTMIAVSHAFTYAGQKNTAKKLLKQALNICTDNKKRLEIIKQLENF